MPTVFVVVSILHQLILGCLSHQNVKKGSEQQILGFVLLGFQPSVVGSRMPYKPQGQQALRQGKWYVLA